MTVTELPRRGHRRLARTRRGYTVVEVMMSLVLLGIGVSGIIALQKVTISSNQHAKALSTATRVAQAWQDQLTVDASLWNGTAGLTNTNWVGDSSLRNWARPSYNSSRLFGAAFDAFGNVLTDTSADVAKSKFCVHVRISPISAPLGGSGTMRTEIRVIWPRLLSNAGTPHFCDVSRDVSALAADVDNFHFLYQTSAVRMQP